MIFTKGKWNKLVFLSWLTEAAWTNLPGQVEKGVGRGLLQFFKKQKNKETTATVIFLKTLYLLRGRAQNMFQIFCINLYILQMISKLCNYTPALGVGLYLIMSAFT